MSVYICIYMYIYIYIHIVKYCKIVAQLINSNIGSDCIRPHLCLLNSLNVIDEKKYLEQDSEKNQKPFKQRSLRKVFSI